MSSDKFKLFNQYYPRWIYTFGIFFVIYFYEKLKSAESIAQSNVSCNSMCYNISDQIIVFFSSFANVLKCNFSLDFYIIALYIIMYCKLSFYFVSRKFKQEYLTAILRIMLLHSKTS